MATQTVIQEIEAERYRQQTGEGWTREHDDAHEAGELALVASLYAKNAMLNIQREAYPLAEDENYRDRMPFDFPWEPAAWKPKDPRRDLIRAAALLVAEIERLDRRATGAPA